ncbi:MAG TPA: TonB-dependent receptor [Thermoanaerobaculia bacterium]
MKHLRLRTAVLMITVLAIALARSATAQWQTGNLYGTVMDTEGRPLAGALVILSGVAAPLEQRTGEQGEFRFLGLAPGSYRLDARHQGFSSVDYEDLIINVGRNAKVVITLSPAVQETLNVVESSPLLDERRVSTGSLISQTQLEKIPTARDPWALLQSVPGVLLDRINVGGSESGTQAQFVGPGSYGSQAVWTLDGVNITRTTSLGSAPGSFDFDAFEEIQVTTGGSDAANSTGGVTINLVTKRGTNQWRGSGRYYYSDAELQEDLDFDEEDLGQPGPWNRNRRQTSFRQGNRIDVLRDLGAEIGGPLWADHLWIWGSYTAPVIHKLTIDDYFDNYDYESYNVKLNAQLTPANSATAFAWNGDYDRRGRGAGPTRPQETTWDQSDFGEEPTVWKLEDTHIFGPNFYLTGLYAKVNGGFELAPLGGDHPPFFDLDGVWHNSFFYAYSENPTDEASIDSSTFFNTGRVSHELKFGAGYRVAEQDSLSRTPGGGYETQFDEGISLLFLARDGRVRSENRYTEAFVQDTLTAGNLTANIGLRYDRQEGKGLDTSVRANTAFPDLLPAASYPGSEAGFAWEDLVPRLGLTYALGAQRKTLVRASYSRYADQLGAIYAAWTNPLTFQQYRRFYSSNLGGLTLEPDDLIEELWPPTAGINPHTLEPLVSNAVDPGLDAPLTDELLLGVQHALRPDLMLGLHLSYRRFTRLIETERLVFDAEDPFAPELLGSLGRLHRRDDYVPVARSSTVAPDGRTYTVEVWGLRDGITSRGGRFLENGDRGQNYKGAFLTLDKRLANRWLARGHVAWQDWRWDIPDSENEDPTDGVAGGLVDDGLVLQGREFVSGAKGGIFINSRWSYSLVGLYQVAPDRPWGFNVAANVNGREGYPLRYVGRFFRFDTGEERPFDVPITSDVNAFRYPDIHLLDLRVEKELLFNRLGVTLGLDVFNVTNESYVLQRQGIFARNNASFVTEVLSPRIYRLGARFSLR